MEDTNEKIYEGMVNDTEKMELLENTQFKEDEKYICKINGTTMGTGFFCKIKFNNKLIPVLMTNYHVINDDFLEKNKFIKIYIKDDYHLININKDSKIYSSIKDKYDLMIIKLNEDNIYNYLEIDSNIFKNDSLSTYSKEHISKGTGIEKINEYDIKHLCNTQPGSSGSPILNLLTNKVIGIHKGTIPKKKINIGTFLKFPLNELNYGVDKLNQNYIIAEIYIKENDINKEIRILNSYEEYMRNTWPNSKLETEFMNEKEITKCEIKINDEVIPFNYFHNFKKQGKNIIKYYFKNYLTNMSYMFSVCSSLTNINLCNFNTQNVTYMSGMFSGCSSLKNINLSNFNTQNVTNMSWMFTDCSSLTNIDLSNFNTQNVTYMSGMFSGCSSLKNINLSNFNTQNVTFMNRMFFDCLSLTNIDLSNFNTQNVTYMNRMFFHCLSLKNINLSNFNTHLTNINLSNFNTQNVTNMDYMFSWCSSLKNIDLSNFNTQNVTYMSGMFFHCSSLKNIDLSNFNTQNVTDMSGMFSRCSSLTKKNVITNDNGIFGQLKYI